jgi:hypothetical protein
MDPEKQTAAKHTSQNLQILASQIDEQNEGLYRILEGTNVRYVRIRSGTFDEETMCWPHLLLPALPTFPAGAWKSMEISRTEDGSFKLDTNSDPLEEVKYLWHPARIDIFSLRTGKRLKTSVHETTYKDQPAILKYASFPWEIYRIQWETWAYHQIESKSSPQDPPLAPSFLGHVHENGRVIGFLLEAIEGESATIADLEICESSIRRLHKLGLRHGDPCRHNFFVDRVNHIARLLDLENARPLLGPDDLAAEEELGMLPKELRDTSDRGAAF